jgi:hypothetical protein
MSAGRDEAGDLEHEVGGIDAGDAGRIERGDDLADVPADDVEAIEPAQDHLDVAHRDAARFRHSRAGGILGIQPVDVDGDVGRAIGEHALDFLDHRCPSQFLVLVHGDHSQTGLLAVPDVVVTVAGAAQADLDHPGRIQQPLLDGPAHEGRVIDLGAHEVVEGVGMRVDLQHAHWPLVRDCPQDRQRHRVIAADGHRRGADSVHTPEEVGDQVDAALDAEGIGRRIADIGDMARPIGIDAGRRVDLANEP